MACDFPDPDMPVKTMNGWLGRRVWGARGRRSARLDPEDPSMLQAYAYSIHLLAGFALLAKLEGVIPALETAHAVAWMSGARGRWRTDDIVLLCVSGRGDKDVQTVERMLGAGGARGWTRAVDPVNPDAAS